MALVILPCDMPWWETLQRYINKLKDTKSVEELITEMQMIHTMCNVGLDPDEPDGADPEVLLGLKSFIIQDLSKTEKEDFFSKTLPIIANAALNLKARKPLGGLPFSLQQEAGTIEVKHDFACSLIAHAFLSTFPKRTHKTHPTLQDFNFCNFFRYLNEEFQKSKLRSVIHYFNLQSELDNRNVDQIKFTRQVMKSQEWLTIDDWLKCESPLCPLTIKHDNRMENAEFANSINVCFSSKKIGGRVLSDGTSAECIQFVTCPELLVTLLCVEALQDNEALMIENLFRVGKINNSRLKGNFESLSEINMCNVCCMDAENYTRLPLNQYDEDSILRELNKALLAFKQKHKISLHHFHNNQPADKRLSPIGESFSTTPTENFCKPNQRAKEPKENTTFDTRQTSKNEFIKLRTSRESQPLSRLQLNSEYSSCKSQDSTPEEYYSARTSLLGYDDDDDDDPSDEEENARRYRPQLDTPDRRISFAERLHEALRRAQSLSSTDSSYAVDISVTGSSIKDSNIRMKRGGSRGFILEEDAYQKPQEVREYCNNEQFSKKYSRFSQSSSNERSHLQLKIGNSSKYSFSTDSDSDSERVYERLTRWLDESEETKLYENDDRISQRKVRDNTVVQFAESLLKRTLSESFVGVPLTDGVQDGEDFNENFTLSRETADKVKTVVRSLSLELAKHDHKLPVHNKFVVGKNRNELENSSKASNNTVITGNWGCGSRHLGDPQLKLFIQWLAASAADTLQLVYYTSNHRKLYKLDTVSRVLVDRRWNVGELIRAVIQYTQYTLSRTQSTVNDDCSTLFDLFINSGEKYVNSAK